ILNSTDEFFVNLTGGTKIMSIGAYTFFKEYASHIFYIPIGKNHYSQIFPKTNQTDVPIHFRASLVEYLTAYGVKITNPSQMHSLVKQPTETEVFFKCYLQTNHSEKAILSGLRESRSMQAKFVNTSAFSGLDQVLCQLQFSPKETGRLNKSEIRYLTGEWLEEYLLARINDFHQLSPPYSGVGIEISRATIRNEFDVMVMLNNTLHVFECKTSVFTGEKSTLWNDTLYKLQALRKDFGLSAKAYIVTLSEIGAAKGQIKLDRSEVFGIQVIDRNTLQSAEMLEDILKKMR
ncbi:MAG TPA: DUF1887 family CARF protein, partial [Acidobacteriota bacterium]|nr:DUF1887 family CARF protein [Acidobacteriota bacterium]